MDLGSGLFVHFGINTFYDVEWSDGTLSPAAYDPHDLDTDQWCRCARAAGMRFVVLTAKHHDGFCNWPTAHTDYSVRAAPWRGGRGDLVGELAASARRHGLELGLYYSLWDRHEPTHDTDEAAYAAFMRAQLAELLTGYGPLVELWFDGMWKKQKTGWEAGEEAFVDAWRAEGALRWRWDDLYAHIKSFQPDCVVLNNTTTRFPGVPLLPVDARPGEKAEGGTGIADVSHRDVWEWDDRRVFLPQQIETTLSQQGPPGDFAHGSWFWHPWDHSVATRDQVREWRRDAVRRGAVLLTNVGPTASGLLRPEDEALLLSLGGETRSR
jgi:alpha-L-fucosidase